MKKERLFYLDFVRAIAVISIVITHFNASYLYLSVPAPEKAVITTTVSNVYIGNWGVSLFFIISGAALMYIYGDRCELKTFYKKRFLSIYPMFWLAYILAFLYEFYTTHNVIGGGAIPKSRILFSAAGFDGLLLTNGVSTFYILGEWFLGVIILMYVFFPLLRWIMNRRPGLLLAAIVAAYIAGLWFCYRGPFQLASATIIFVRLPELVFGMYFVKYGLKVNWSVAITALAVLIVNGIVKPSLPGDIQTTYVGIASFLVLVYISYFLKMILIEKVCSVISKYSYAVFLVHHIVITKMMATFDLNSITLLHSYLLFLCVCCVIAILAYLLYGLHNAMMKQIIAK